MLRQTFAAIATIMLMTPAQAGDSIEVKGATPATPQSITFVGYDYDANGNPVCAACDAKRAEEAAQLKAYAERRERSRQYMARLQGRELPATKTPVVATVGVTSPIAANAAELVPAGEPAPEKTL